MNDLSVSQSAEKWSISTRRIQILCEEESIPGEIRVGEFRAIPDDAVQLADARTRIGKYIKKTIERKQK